MINVWPFRRKPPEKLPARTTTEVLAEEYEHIAPGKWVPRVGATQPEMFKKINELPPSERPSALCLSGGGIRSATFCLGVLQQFASTGRLAEFSYLSSVSGGGYIASWLSNWRAQRKWNWARVEGGLRSGVSTSANSHTLAGWADKVTGAPLARLRAYSNYLSPVGGFSADTLTLAAIFLRNLLLNWLIWVPLLCLLVMLPRLYVSLLVWQPPRAKIAFAPALAPLSVAILLVVIAIAYIGSDLPGPAKQTPQVKPLPKSKFVTYCFAPMLIASVLVSITGFWAINIDNIDQLPWYYFLIGGVIVHCAGISYGHLIRGKKNLLPRPFSVTGVIAVAVAGGLGGWLLWVALFYAVPRVDPSRDQILFYATFSVPIMLACFWIVMSLYAGLTGRSTSEDDREWWARATAFWLCASVAWLSAFALVVYLPPLVFDQLSNRLPTGAQVTIGGTILGAITSVIGFWSKNGAKVKQRANTIMQALRIRLLDLMAATVIITIFIGLSLLVSWLLENCHDGWLRYVCTIDIGSEVAYLRQDAVLSAAEFTSLEPKTPSGSAQTYVHVLMRTPVETVASLMLAFFVLAAIVSSLIGVNTFSLHAMYGNRLVRAYLGAGRRKRKPHWFTGFDPGDNPALTSILPPCGRPSLFPVINIALNLVQPSGRRLAWQQRKACSFTASPLHCGADGVGYVKTDSYGGDGNAKNPGMTLGRALTISGAAASPNMGYHSSPLVTFVMTLFNVRLGWWLPNPSPKYGRVWQKSQPGNALLAMLGEALGRTTEDRESVYLSDGGHFENLGLYEMVRRRCHRIVVVDATCDPKFEYADLLNAVRRIRVDFGISIELPPVLPGIDGRTARARIVVGRIRYSMRDGTPDSEDGYLYLIKPRLIGDEPPDLKQYAESAGDSSMKFPHQSTADQFFDETQFESYRMLGLWTAQETFSANPLEWPVQDSAELVSESLVEQKNIECQKSAAPATAYDGLADAVSKFKMGAALATALTVGGTLGVVGTISVAPGEIHLSAQDRELLQKGAKVTLTLDEKQFGGVRTVLDETRSAVSGLRDASKDLREAAERLRNEPEPEFLKVLEEIRYFNRRLDEIQILVDRRISTASPETVEAINRVTSKIGEVVVAIEKMKGSTTGDQKSEINGDVVMQLRDINTKLGNIHTAVTEGNPRANVRGRDGGER